MLGLLLVVRIAFPAPCLQYDLNNEKVFSCPGPDLISERVNIRYRGSQLKISCVKCEVKSNEVTRYLKSIPIPQNLTRVRIRDCLLPNKSFKVWLESMNSLPERLKELEVSLFTNCSSHCQVISHSDLPQSCFRIHSNLFKSLHNLQRLRLSLDLTTSLPAGIFDDLINLRELTVKGRLSSIEQGLLGNLKELRILDIGGNQLSRAPSLEQLRKLEQLYIGHNRISQLNQSMLLYNSVLVLFKATNNAISQIPENFFNSCWSLKTIWLDQNNLTSLPKALLQNLTSLATLSLASNRLTNVKIEAETFHDLKNLKELHLENNMLTSPLSDILPASKTISFLVLTNNMLTVFEKTWHKKWPKLALLQLDNNSIGLDENLHSKLSDFFDCEQNIKISLANNTITSFPLLFPSRPQRNQIVIDLRGNKLNCDCQTLNLWKLIKFSNQSIRIEGGVHCLNLNDVLLAEVSPSKLSCPFPCTQVSPRLLMQDCACRYFPSIRETEVNCSSKSVSTAKSPWLASINQTKAITFYQKHRNITTLTDIFDARTKDLIKLFDVSHNKISAFAFSQLPPKLKSLYLNDNKIKTLEISTELKNISDLRLGGNPFACDCRSLSLIQFLQHFGSKVTDKDDINFDCHSLKPFKTNVIFDKSYVCPDQLPMYLGLSLVMAIILVLILVYATSKKERLQFCFFSLPWMRRLYLEDWSLPYDVFISFSHHQEDFAEDLRHHLENEFNPGYR